MIIKVEKLKTKGYLTRTLNKREKIYTELIEEHKESIEMYKDLYDESEPRGNPEIFIKRIKEMTVEEKHALYDRAQLLTDDIKSQRTAYLKDFEELNEYDFYALQTDLYTFGKRTCNETVLTEIDYEENLIKNLTNAKNSTYIFSLDKSEINPINFLYFKKYARELLKMGKQIRFVVSLDMTKQDNEDRINYMYSKEEFDLLVELDNFLKKNNSEGVLFREFLGIEDESDLEQAWNLDQVVRVNTHIDRLANIIKKNDYSPFETMVFLHKFVTTNFYYNKGGLEESRILPGIYYNTKIVCSGYATLIKAIIDRLDNPNLKAKVMGCKLYENTEPYKIHSSHCQNLIYIKDDKYDIDGYYIEDATFDSKRLFNGSRDDGGLAHCLLPLNALRHFRYYIYANVYDKNRYRNIMVNNTSIKGINENYRPLIERKFSKRSSCIGIQKYVDAMNVVFKKRISNKSFDVFKEIEKSVNKSHNMYTHRADITFMSAESKLLRAVFGKRKIRK